MKISTANAYDASIDALTRKQTELSRLSQQLSTSKRINKASDDPSAAARAERALASEMRTEANQRAVDASQNAMTLSESAMADAVGLMQQAREILVASGNASYTDAERLGLANELLGLRKQLMGVANRTDGAGVYLFGGQGADQQPFVDAAGGLQFRGTAGEINGASGEPLPLTVDGELAWMRARTGNGVFQTQAVTSTGSAWVDNGRVTDPGALTGSTYSIQFSVVGGVTTYSVLQDGAPTAIGGAPFVPGTEIEVDGIAVTITGNPADGDQFDMVPSTADLNVFDVLEQTITDLRTPLQPDSQRAQALSSNLGALDATLVQMQSIRSRVGETLNRIDSVTGRLSALKLSSQTERANAEGLDMVAAISEFQDRQTSYDAALKSYSLVQRLSLFNYLSA